MGSLSIEVKPVGFSDVALSGHLLLVYSDDLSNESVVRGGPAQLGPGFGPLVLERGIPIDQSVDRRIDPVTGQPLSPADRGNRSIDLGGRNAEDVWNLILQYAEQIHTRAFPYLLLDRNSNTVIRELLALVDINLSQTLPSTQFVSLSGQPFVGIESPDSVFAFDYSITGTARADRIIGRGGNQTFLGGNGEDLLAGGSGNDLLSGENDNDRLEGGTGDDTLTGGSGNDLLIGSAGRDWLGGGANADRFRFDSLPVFGAASADHITDYAGAEGDRIEVSRSGFGIAATSVSLRTVTNAVGLFGALFSASLFIYDSRFGQLYWNQNGISPGAGSGGIFAVLDPVAGSTPTLAASGISLV